MTSVSTGPQPLGGYNTATYTKAAIQSAPGAWTTANSPLTLFTITGSVLCRVFGVVGATAFTSTIDLGTLAVGIVASTQLFLPTSAVSNAGGQFAIGAVWVDATPTLYGEVLVSANLTWAAVGATPIILTIATQNMAAGAVTMVCQWVPLVLGSTVV